MAKIDKLLKQAEEHFDEGELALHAVMGAYETEIMGRASVRNGIFIATSNRLLFYAKKLTGYDLEALPYSNVSSMEMGKSMMGAYISFFASGNSAKMKWINVGDVRAFVDEVKARMESSKTSAPAAPAVDPVSQLERLGKLRDAGVLTEAEFESKKAEILSRI